MGILRAGARRRPVCRFFPTCFAMMILHYIFDPLCGWCYAAAPLVEVARSVPGVDVRFHAGGMMTGPNRRAITPEWRAHVMPHDLRIAKLTGQVFGDAYLDGLLNDTGAVMDSEPPTTAILAAEALGGRGLDMLSRQQRAHYIEGRRIADPAVLAALAVDIGLHPQSFTAFYGNVAGKATRFHIESSRHLLEQVGGKGFPTFVLERGNQRETLSVGAWLGQPDVWREYLLERRREAQT
jgi:putative protein-disulfide isomerase